MDDIDKCRTEIQNLSQLVCQLKVQNEMKDEKIQDLEKRVEDLEQYTCQDDLIVTGLKTSHKSYTRAVHSDDMLDSQDAPQDKLASLKDQVSSFIEKRWVLHLGNQTLVLAIHYQAKKPIPNIVIRFTNRKIKNNILCHGRDVKGCSVYINEHLTSKKTVKLQQQLHNYAKTKDFEYLDQEL